MAASPKAHRVALPGAAALDNVTQRVWRGVSLCCIFEHFHGEVFQKNFFSEICRRHIHGIYHASNYVGRYFLKVKESQTGSTDRSFVLQILVPCCTVSHTSWELDGQGRV
jgi:hypothetical protein